MKIKELHEMTNTELETKLGELKSELFNLRFSHATGQLENPKLLAILKKNIARINTLIRERQLKAKA
jgi:large subunit ribosomal protein L29